MQVEGLTIDDEEFVEAMMRRALAAREDFIEFIQFAGWDELTLEPVTPASHQVLIGEFLLAHPKALVIAPPGFAKTWTAAMLLVWCIGRNPNVRAAVVSWTEEQASKILALARDLIERSPYVKLVFPELRRSSKPGDAWTTTNLVVERNISTRDDTVEALGIKSGSILGSRKNFILIDDVLTEENTRTREQRDHVYDLLDKQVLRRLDPPLEGQDPPRFIFTNTAWHHEDALHRYKDPSDPGRVGMPCLRFEAPGNVYFYNTDWDTDLVRPATSDSAPEECRLAAHDPDPENTTPLWPGRFSTDKLVELRKNMLDITWIQQYLGLVRDEEKQWCKQEYIDLCFSNGRGLELLPDNGGIERVWHGPGIAFTGVDLAFREGEERDFTVFFTFAVLPDGRRRVLDIEWGQWPGQVIVDKMIQKQRAYDSILSVETNGAQKLVVDFGLAADVALPVKGRTTTARKWDPTYGVPSLFIEMANGAWIFPCNRYGGRPAALQRFSKDCKDFVPAKHTADAIMAACMGREQAREWGFGVGGKVSGKLGALPAGPKKRGMTTEMKQSRSIS